MLQRKRPENHMLDGLYLTEVTVQQRRYVRL